MKINTAYLKILFFSLFVFFPAYAFAEYVPTEVSDVNVNANIQVDLYSTVTLRPATVNVYQPSTVEIKILSPSGQPITNHTVLIVASGVNIVQPSSSTDILGKTTGTVSSALPGTYTICAKDITFGYDIAIASCKTLYVTLLPVPTVLEEPQYTKGNSNMILWQSLGTGYQYVIQASTSSDFSSIFAQSVNVSGSSYEFSNLANGQMYFYRVKAKNLYGGESAWSNTVFSVQDSEKPLVETLSIGDVGENNTVKWDNSFEVNMVFRVTDNLGVASTKFLCVRKDGSTRECSDSVDLEGDNLNVGLRLDSLERVSGVYLYESYEFCVEATDVAGNVNRVCGINLVIPKGEVEQPGGNEEPNPPSKPTVTERIEKSIDDINVALDNSIGNLEQDNLQTVTTTTGIVTVSTALTFAAGTIWEIPYFISQIVLSLLSWFGFRKKGKHFGYVYDGVTKEPVSQAIVRIFDDEGRMVWSDVTDSNGYFNAELKEGHYKIKVRSANHIFPSRVVFGREDYPLSNVYHGEEFELGSGQDIKFAIPVDPVELSRLRKLWVSVYGRFKWLLNILHVVLFLGGCILSVYAYSRYPNTLNLVILLLFIPSFFLIVRNLFSKKGKYGIVRDVNKRVVEGVTVGLREMEFEKIVSKRVTDEFGRYRFVIGKGQYELEVLETGYRVESIDGGSSVLVKGADDIIARDIVVSDTQKK